MAKPRKKSGKTEMRFEVLNAFVDFSLRGTRPLDANVWFVLYRDVRDGVARTGQSDIARRAGCSVRTVRRAIARLVDQGLITVERQGSLRVGVSTYQVRPMSVARLDELLTRERAG